MTPLKAFWKDERWEEGGWKTAMPWMLAELRGSCTLFLFPQPSLTSKNNVEISCILLIWLWLWRIVNWVAETLGTYSLSQFHKTEIGKRYIPTAPRFRMEPFLASLNGTYPCPSWLLALTSSLGCSLACTVLLYSVCISSWCFLLT